MIWRAESSLVWKKKKKLVSSIFKAFIYKNETKKGFENSQISDLFGLRVFLCFKFAKLISFGSYFIDQLTHSFIH